MLVLPQNSIICFGLWLLWLYLISNEQFLISDCIFSCFAVNLTYKNFSFQSFEIVHLYSENGNIYCYQLSNIFSHFIQYFKIRVNEISWGKIFFRSFYVKFLFFEGGGVGRKFVLQWLKDWQIYVPAKLWLSSYLFGWM